jgi:hypothetical protein
VTVLVSSPDETRSSILVGAEFVRDAELGFSDIPEFIQVMVAVARQLPHLDFVFRLHPRLLPNKRERVTSPDLAAIQASLNDLPRNAVINSPGQQLSLYDIIRISSVAVNQSSSAGLEFLALGLPVVQYDAARQNAYLPSFGEIASRNDEDGLSTAIRCAIESGWSLENSRKAYRWLTAILLRATLHLEPLDVPNTFNEIESRNQVTAKRTSSLSTWRTAIPRGLRERASRSRARRARKSMFIDTPDASSWASEWISRIDALDNHSMIWEPLIVPRGAARLDQESASLAQLVEDFRSRVIAGDDEGLGALADH